MGLIYGLTIPFLGTLFGSGMVFLMKDKINKKLEKFLLGFASGVMIAASIWSLLIPSIEMAKNQGRIEWIPAAVGFLIGIIFLLVLDSIIPHLHINNEKPEGLKLKIQKATMMVLAVTLHNIPEGMTLRSRICRSYGREYRNNYCRCNCVSTWYSNTKFSRGCNNFYAT